MKIILASSSPYRAQQLKDAGVCFEIYAPKTNESELKQKHSSLEPFEICALLSMAKALDACLNYSEGIIIASDQVCILDNQIFDKAGEPNLALQQLLRLSGKTHQLVSSLCVLELIDGKHKILFHNNVISRMSMRQLDEMTLSNYIREDESWSCAGGYKYELQGHTLFENVDTPDPSAIIGLPMISLLKTLNEAKALVK